MSARQLHLRIGYISIPLFVGYDAGSWTGAFSTICEVFHGWTEGVNRTLVGAEGGFGHFNQDTGKYSGVLALLQKDEVDMVFDPNVDFNLVQGHGVIRGQLMECNPPAIISGYNSSTSRLSTDILMDTSRDIGYGNLLLFLISFTLLTHLLSKNGKRVGGRYFAIKSVFHYIMQKIPIKTYNLRTIVISTSLSLTLFYLILSFVSLLHVSLVKFPPPVVVQNYDDIIERLEESLEGANGRNFNVEWSGEYPDSELFRLGEKGSKENQIWERVVKQGGPNYVKLGLDMTRADKLIKSQSMVVIINEGYAYFVRHSLCSYNNDITNFHSWVSKDKDAKWNQKGYVIRESLETGTPLRSWIDTRTQRVHESGLMIYSDRMLKELKFDGYTYDRKNCSSDVVVVGNYDFGEKETLGHEQFKVTYLICCIISTTALITLICEKIYYFFISRKNVTIKIIVVKVNHY